jgi:hypothetical protein
MAGGSTIAQAAAPLAENCDMTLRTPRPGRALRLVPLLAACAWPATATAARPFATEDAGVLAPRECEAEPVLGRIRAQGQDTTRTTTLQGACGVAAGTQLSAGLTHATAGGVRERSLAFGGKTQLMDGGEAGSQVAVAYGAGFLHGDGGGHRLDTAAALLVLTRPLVGGLLFHANLGTLHSRPDRQQSTTWAAALEYPAGGGVDVGVEAFGDDRTRSWLGAGLRWAVHPVVSLNLAHAAQQGGDKGRVTSVGMRIGF